MSNDWHMLTKDLSDTPTKDGFYQLAYIREDGEQRVGKAYFRTKTKKKHFTDEHGRTHIHASNSGWHMSANAKMKTVVAWREMQVFPWDVQSPTE